MAFVRAQVTLAKVGALPEDQVVNTFHFSSLGDFWLPENVTTATGLLSAFYNGIENYLAQSLTGAATVEYYNLDDPQPRVPFATDTLTGIVPGGTTPLPSEVAICLSYRGTQVSGVPMARRRGRLYIGPLGTNAIPSGIANEPRPQAALVTALTTAATALAGPAGSAEITWSVFSPTTLSLGGSLPDAFTPVVAGWVDNSFDTQRRRGAATTSRTVWTA